MLATSSAFCEKATLDTLATELKTYTKVCEFDELGMLRKTEVHCAGSSILSDVITYKKNVQNTTQCVENEKFTHNGGVRTREYITDSYGRVTSVTDSVLGSHTYEYDYRGFLVKEDDTVYEYDGNGNITRAGDKVFTYDSVIKDRLMSVGGKAITYSESNPLNPKTYDGKTFEFEGRRLAKVSSGNMVATYQYDDTGLRTEKTVTKNGVATTTKFVYNGGKLIAEYTGTKRVDYLYDENGMLYGFIYNNAKYFYIRDTLQNILGIVDANGNVVVNYYYSAYGECQKITGSKATTIGVINSFRYKGYYFDAETEFFYCNARYYVHGWCRFLNFDTPNCLDIYSANNVNLYAYCSADPVNRSDSNGHSWKTFWKSAKKWASNTFGAFVDLSYNVVKESYDYLFGGYETGVDVSGTIGDDSKPVSVYVTNASEWWKIWEYQVGVQISKGDYGASFSVGVGEVNFSADIGNTSTELQCGINKIGIKSSYTSEVVTTYSQLYIRTIPAAALVVLAVYAPELIPVVAPLAYA